MDITHNNVDRQHDLAGEYEGLQELGDCYASVENYTQAKLCYEKAANLAPDEPGPYVGLGVVALQENHFDDAEIAFRVACRLDAACAKAYAGLGMVAQQRTDYKQAFEMYLKCLERDQDNMIAGRHVRHVPSGGVIYERWQVRQFPESALGTSGVGSEP